MAVPEKDFDQKPGHFVEAHAISGEHGEGGQKSCAQVQNMILLTPKGSNASSLYLTQIQHHNHREEFAEGFCLLRGQIESAGMEGRSLNPPFPSRLESSSEPLARLPRLTSVTVSPTRLPK